MKTRWIVALVLSLLFVFAWRPRHRTTDDTPSVGADSTPPPSVSAPARLPGSDAPLLPSPPAKPFLSGETSSTVPPSPSAPPAAPPLPASIPSPEPVPALTEVRDEVENLQFALRDYRAARRENPIGSNAEITNALLGDNLKQVKIPLPPGASVNADGQMCDRWGTPYFFHQLSGKQMEIRSAGPDREMNSGDDVVTR